MRIYVPQAVDVFRFRGASYGEAGPERQFRRKRPVTDAGAHVGWGNGKYLTAYAGVEAGGLVQVGGDISAVIPLSRHWYAPPHFEWSWLTSAEVRRAVPPGSVWNAGAAIGVNF